MAQSAEERLFRKILRESDYFSMTRERGFILDTTVSLYHDKEWTLDELRLLERVCREEFRAGWQPDEPWDDDGEGGS
jgi:hypothetical protein